MGLYDQSFGTPPTIPTNVTGSNQQFSSNFMPNASGGPGSTGAQEAAYIQRNPNSQRANYYNSLPQNFTPAQFNQVAQTNPVLATQMLGQGGQAYRNAVMAQNGWSNLDMNRFINGYGSGAMPGFGQGQLSQLRSMGIAPASPSGNGGGGVLSNPNAYGAGYTGYGNSNLAGTTSNSGGNSGSNLTATGNPNYNGGSTSSPTGGGAMSGLQQLLNGFVVRQPGTGSTTTTSPTPSSPTPAPAAPSGGLNTSSFMIRPSSTTTTPTTTPTTGTFNPNAGFVVRPR